jgi:methionyl-tRNA formyltransferase
VPKSLKRILLIGDNSGIPQLLERIDHHRIVGLMGASIRPNYNEFLSQQASGLGGPFCIQPRTSDREAYRNFVRDIEALKPDGIICNSYSMLLREEILSLVNGQAFNLHFSLLPRNRGPNPIQWALIHGDDVAGATIHVMGAGFDDGPIVDQISVGIDETDTWVTLLDRVNNSGLALLDRALPKIVSGAWSSRPQDESQAVTNARIPKESFQVTLADSTDREIFNLIRAQVTPLAGAYLNTSSGTLRFKNYKSLTDVREIRNTRAQ